MKKIGVFICWCGANIADVVNIDKILGRLRQYPGVVHCEAYKYFCSAPGQEIMERTIKEKRLEGVVIAACSPAMHENTFRQMAQRAGLNPYQLEIANIREQCSWVHRHDPDRATDKAWRIITAIIEKVKGNQDLVPLMDRLCQRALVIGGGIAGIQAALDIAQAGYEVVLVEREPSVGGHMAQLSETFPTLDCSQCIMTPRMAQLQQTSAIKLMTYCEVEEIKGYVGNFTVTIREKTAYVDRERCTGCGVCIEKCPTKVTSEFNAGLGQRKAIYIPYAQAVPNKPVIDADHCRYLLKGKCGVCERFCEAGAIDFQRQDRWHEVHVGAIVVATGFELLAPDEIGSEYGYGIYPDVITSLQFERLCSASGPTGGKIRRPSNGQSVKSVVFIKCVGSRNPESGRSYCSKICCMYSAKHAMLYKKKEPQGQAYIFYMDIRSAGKDYEEFVQRGISEEGTLYLRGRVAKVFEEDGQLVVWGADTLTGKKIEIRTDLVVLALAVVPHPATRLIVQKLNISTNKDGFLNEAHPKLRPVESQTRGIFFTGCAQGPKDIPETVAQSGCAAVKVAGLLSHDQIENEPTVAVVDPEVCAACALCVPACPYDARVQDPLKEYITVQEMLCQGCGACVAVCPNGASSLRNSSTSQVLNMIAALE